MLKHSELIVQVFLTILRIKRVIDLSLRISNQHLFFIIIGCAVKSRIK
jgi:hypothetical protein